jgi:hypothetical protein
MLRLNHAHLPSRDVAALSDFLVRHFDFRAVATRGEAFAVLEDAGGFVLALMRTREPLGLADHVHVGFFVGSREAVHAKHAELVAAGITPGEVEDVSRAGFSSLTFYSEAPGGLLVEVSHHG